MWVEALEVLTPSLLLSVAFSHLRHRKETSAPHYLHKKEGTNKSRGYILLQVTQHEVSRIATGQYKPHLLD